MTEGSCAEAMSSSSVEPDGVQGARDIAALRLGTRVIVRYKLIGHIEIDCKMQQVVYERIIL